MVKTGKYDEVILGAILGLALTYPKLGQWTTDFFNSILPLDWYFFGNFSLPIYGMIVFGIIGFIVGKTR